MTDEIRKLREKVEEDWPPRKHLLRAIDAISDALREESAITDSPHMNIGPSVATWADCLEAGIWPPEHVGAADLNRPFRPTEAPDD